MQWYKLYVLLRAEPIKILPSILLRISQLAKAPLHPWVWPIYPREHIYVDFLGPFQGKIFFLVTDRGAPILPAKKLEKQVCKSNEQNASKIDKFWAKWI